MPRITATSIARRKRLASAKLELCEAVTAIEKKYDLTILEGLDVLQDMVNAFVRSGLQLELEEREGDAKA